MVNTKHSNTCGEMGAFAFRKSEQDKSPVPSLFSKQMEMGSRVYKLLIHIEKIRPKPCPKSKKLGFQAQAKKLEQIIIGSKSATANEPFLLPRKTAECNICKEILQSAQSLYLHKKKLHCHICDICHIEFATKSICEVHQKFHDSNDTLLPYKCHVCLDKFGSKKKTRLHVRAMHTVELNNGKFEKQPAKDSSCLETPHRKKIAQNVGQFKFGEKIDEKFTKDNGRSAGNYTGLIFTCRVCNKDFKTVEAAEAHTIDHMEIVKEEHKCSICKKIFNSESSLNDHLAEHLSRALRCPVCPKVFINRATLRIHMKSHGHG